MAFSNARADNVALPPTRTPWVDLAVAITGTASLASAVGVAFLLGIQGPFFVALLATGILLFAVAMVLVARDATHRWLAFGAAFGFYPGSRRALLDFGTDRPVLHGSANGRPARLRLVLTRERAGHAPGLGREWLDLETDLLMGEHDEPALAARARTLARLHAPHARLRITSDRIALRAPFEPDAPRALVEGLSKVVDGLAPGHA